MRHHSFLPNSSSNLSPEIAVLSDEKLQMIISHLENYQGSNFGLRISTSLISRPVNNFDNIEIESVNGTTIHETTFNQLNLTPGIVYNAVLLIEILFNDNYIYEIERQFNIVKAPKIKIMLSNGGSGSETNYDNFQGDGGGSSNSSGSQNCPITFLDDDRAPCGTEVNLFKQPSPLPNDYVGDVLRQTVCSTILSVNSLESFVTGGTPMNVLAKSIFDTIPVREIKQIWQSGYENYSVQRDSMDIEIIVGNNVNHESNRIGQPSYNQIISDNISDNFHLIFVGSSHGGENMIEMFNDMNPEDFNQCHCELIVTWDSTDASGTTQLNDDVPVTRFVNFFQRYDYDNSRGLLEDVGDSLTCAIWYQTGDHQENSNDEIDFTGVYGHTAFSKMQYIHNKTKEFIIEAVQSTRIRYRNQLDI